MVFRLWNETNKTWFIIKYERPEYFEGFVLQSKKHIGSSRPTLIKIGKRNDLIDDLCNLCDSPSKINLVVRDIFVDHPVYGCRKRCIKERTVPLKIEGWECLLEPEHDKQLTISTFQYDKLN